jgi:hypothetical protein
MTRKSKPQPARFRHASQPEPSVVDAGRGRIVARPDGYHWTAPDGKREFGPFETLEAAQAEMEAGADEAGLPVSSDILREVEHDIGLADWIDPETGEPADGQFAPHLDEE